MSPEQSLTASRHDRFDQWLEQLWHIRAVLARAAFLAGIGTVGALLLLPRQYSSDFSVLPQQEASASRLGGIAAQLGVSLAGGAGGQTPDFYAELARTRRVVAAIESKAVPSNVTGGDTTWTTLADALEIVAPTPEVRRLKTILALGERIDARASLKTGVVRVSVKLPDPAMSQFVAQRVLMAMNEFNDNSRQVRAKSEVRFLESRLQRADEAVHDVENRSQRFLELNRQYEQSPPLKFAYERLQRELMLALELQRDLRERLQQSSVESTRDTPLLSTIDEPERPARSVRRYIAAISAVAAVGTAVFIGLLLAFLMEFESAPWLSARFANRLRSAVGLPQQ